MFLVFYKTLRLPQLSLQALNKNSTNASEHSTSNLTCSTKTDLHAIIKIGIEDICRLGFISHFPK